MGLINSVGESRWHQKWTSVPAKSQPICSASTFDERYRPDIADYVRDGRSISTWARLVRQRPYETGSYGSCGELCRSGQGRLQVSLRSTNGHLEAPKASPDASDSSDTESRPATTSYQQYHLYRSAPTPAFWLVDITLHADQHDIRFFSASKSARCSSPDARSAHSKCAQSSINIQAQHFKLFRGAAYYHQAADSSSYTIYSRAS